MKKYFILLLCFVSFTSYAQTKEYYRKNGVISNSTTRSGVSEQFVCELSSNTASWIYNLKNKIKSSAPLKKDGEEGDFYEPQIVLSDPAIFCKIIAPILKKHSLELFDHGIYPPDDNDYLNSLSIMVTYDSATGGVLEVMFYFSNFNKNYASHIPIETYIEIEKEIKKRVKGTVTEEGKSRIFCKKTEKVFFKPKK